MRKLFFSFAFLIFAVVSYAQEKPFVREQPFPNPQNTAQEVANLVFAKGTPVDQVSNEDYMSYRVRVFSDFGRVYEIYVGVTHQGPTSLHLDYYLTTRRFSNLSPADVIADELMYGSPKIFQEVHMLDLGVKGTVDIYQMFYKYRHHVWEGFTREERDLGEKAGIKEYLYRRGTVYRKRKFRNDRFESASPEERKEVQDEYQRHLDIVKALLSK